jgi:hypothetical protein
VLCCSAFDRAKDALESGRYKEVIPLCTEEIETPTSNLLPQALLLRGTFYILSGMGQQGLEDIERLLRHSDLPPRVSNSRFIFGIRGVDNFFQDTHQTGKWFGMFTHQVRKQLARNIARVSERQKKKPR